MAIHQPKQIDHRLLDHHGLGELSSSEAAALSSALAALSWVTLFTWETAMLI